MPKKPVKVAPITQAGKKARPLKETRNSMVRKMMKVFHPPADIEINHKSIALLIKRGFTVSDFAEQWLVSRPSAYKIVDKQHMKVLLHPGIVLYINARNDELIAATDV